MNPMILDRCDHPSYRTFTHDRFGPTYMRGLPTWLWQPALWQRSCRHDVASVT